MLLKIIYNVDYVSCIRICKSLVRESETGIWRNHFLTKLNPMHSSPLSLHCWPWARDLAKARSGYLARVGPVFQRTGTTGLQLIGRAVKLPWIFYGTPLTLEISRVTLTGMGRVVKPTELNTPNSRAHSCCVCHTSLPPFIVHCCTTQL